MDLGFLIFYRGITGGWAGWAIAHLVFGRIEGAAGQRRRAALLIAHPVFGSQLRVLCKQIGEKLSTFYIMQSILMAVQKGNAVCVRGCPQKLLPDLEGLFSFHVQEAEML